jgi:hypothetical protein
MPNDYLPSASPDFSVVVIETGIERPIDEAWSIIGNFQAAGRFLDVPIKDLHGERGIGDVRQVGSQIIEAVVGATRYSYTYVQTHGPMAEYLYHGCFALEANGACGCKLTYTLLYDQSSMSVDRQAQEFKRLTDRFGGMVHAMKAAAEGSGRHI